MMHVESSRHAQVGSSGPLRQMLIIGGTSDLSRRHLLPALTRLLANDELPEGFGVTLTGLEPMSTEELRKLAARELAAHAAHLPLEARQSLVERVSYLQADVGDANALGRPATAAEPLLIYVATPAAAVPAALRAVGNAALNRSARIVLDKPFGLSRESAQALNAQALELVEERDLYRIDHFLYHHAVQELVRRRVRSDPFSLADVLPLAEVEIVWDETRVAESRSLPYPGVTRDMIQSHLLLLAAVTTMDTPASMTRPDLARSRLEALRRISGAPDVRSRTLRARLVAHDDTSLSRAVPGEPETFVTLELRSQMPRWKDVPFVLRASKGVDQSRRHIELRLEGRPDRGAAFVRLEVLSGKLVVGARGAEAPLELAVSADPESASTRLLRAALVGDDTFTLSAEEPEEAWRIVEPMLQAWETSDDPMLTYGVGTSAASILEAGAWQPGA